MKNFKIWGKKLKVKMTLNCSALLIWEIGWSQSENKVTRINFHCESKEPILNSYVYRLFSLGSQESYCHCFHSFLPCAASPPERKLKHYPIGIAAQTPQRRAFHLKSWLDSRCLQNNVNLWKIKFFLKVSPVHSGCGMGTSLQFGRSPQMRLLPLQWLCNSSCPLVIPHTKSEPFSWAQTLTASAGGD